MDIGDNVHILQKYCKTLTRIESGSNSSYNENDNNAKRLQDDVNRNHAKTSDDMIRNKMIS